MKKTIELLNRFCGNELCRQFETEVAHDSEPARRHLYVNEAGTRFYLCDCCHYAVWLAIGARQLPN